MATSIRVFGSSLLACLPVIVISNWLVLERSQASAQETEPLVPTPVVFTVQQDHQNMMEQLGITKLRPGRNGNANATGENAANYDESKANPFLNYPDPLKMENGSVVNSAEQWWQERRPEIVELFEREVVGRVPADVPKITWQEREVREISVGGRTAIEKHLIGTADNSACPQIAVNISMSLTVPKEVDAPVPVLMLFGWTPFEPSPFGPGFGRGREAQGPTKYDKIIEAGWGYAIINPSTIQDDAGGWRPKPWARRNNPDAAAEQPVGAGLTRGIIGLTNMGQPRKPDQWGALRAWAWGASRGLDYLETVPSVDAKRVAIDGVSRYGKAALITLAFDQRFAAGLIASSGEGGTSPYRRNFGEAVENLTGSGAYHWMAGNFIKYGAEESSFGAMNASHLPVDSHLLIALCAPRLTFISHGVPEKGDALWLDQQGSFMASIAAQPVFRLLGADDLGRSDDYMVEKMPPVNVDLLNGELAWRQHDGGHTDDPNIEHFLKWANRFFDR